MLIVVAMREFDGGRMQRRGPVCGATLTCALKLSRNVIFVALDRAERFIARRSARQACRCLQSVAVDCDSGEDNWQ